MFGGATLENAHRVLGHEGAAFEEIAPPPCTKLCDASPAALTAFVTENHAFTWRMARRLGVPESSVDDAVQQVFMIVVQRLGGVIEGKQRSFLFSTILRVAANMRRSDARRREREIEWDEDPPEIVSAAPTPEESLSQAERRALLDEVLAQLPLEQRTVLVLAELEGMSAPEIAALVEIPIGTVTSRLRRARELALMHVRRLSARHGDRGGSR